MTVGPKFKEPITIHDVSFSNRLLRSSIGGRTCNYDGTVTDIWKNFEKRFADGGVGGIISTTFHVHEKRLSPPQYPSIATRRHMLHLKKRLPEIQQGGRCRYIVQIGDPGYVTYSSLFSEDDDGLSSSDGRDFAFGYNNRRRAMSTKQIEQSIAEHAAAALRAREAGADGVEIVAGKGYLIHQFLNPAINRRQDDWGGSEDARFRLLDRILKAVRAAVGKDFLLGVRLSGADFNASPLLLAAGRWPSPLVSAALRRGNDVHQMARYAKRMQGVDYLHVVAGYGFPNPHDVPGAFPFREVRCFFDSVRHLSGKAKWRAALAHLPMPERALHWFTNLGWDPSFRSLSLANEIKKQLPSMTVITNGCYETLESINEGLEHCDMVSMARALIANPKLINTYLNHDRDVPEKERCTRCNRCVGRTTTSPLGCYDVSRFGGSYARMFAEIMKWNQPDRVPGEEDRPVHFRGSAFRERG
jgi:NADH:flavin oxidoreductases, Old Yellow Enzyme family